MNCRIKAGIGSAWIAIVAACLPPYLGEPCENDLDCGTKLACRSLESGKSCQILSENRFEIDRYEPGMLKQSREGHFLAKISIDPPPQLGGTLWTLVVFHLDEEGVLDPVRGARFAIRQVMVRPNGEEMTSAIEPLAIHLKEHYYQLGLIFEEPGLWQIAMEIDDGMHSDKIVMRMEVDDS